MPFLSWTYLPVNYAYEPTPRWTIVCIWWQPLTPVVESVNRFNLISGHLFTRCRLTQSAMASRWSVRIDHLLLRLLSRDKCTQQIRGDYQAMHPFSWSAIATDHYRLLLLRPSKHNDSNNNIPLPVAHLGLLSAPSSNLKKPSKISDRLYGTQRSLLL